VLSLQIFSQFEPRKIQAFHLGTLWRHSWDTAQLAKDIAAGEDRSAKKAEQSFTAGLLHDIGKLLLAANLPEVYQEALDMAQTLVIPIPEAERNVIGASHAEIGGYLLGLWGLPQPVVDAVAFHHHPNQCPQKDFQPLTAVHVANALDRSKSAPGLPMLNDEVDHDYLDQLGFTSRLEEWRNLVAPAEEPMVREPELAAF
jgi:putative nucleotidyltransferase with HDIG domain